MNRSSEQIMEEFKDAKTSMNEWLEAKIASQHIDEIIKKLEKGETISEKTIIMDEKGFDAATITADDVSKYGI